MQIENKVESNRYKCIRLLGEGSFGKAFLVECPDKSLAVVKTIYLENMNEEEKKESYLEGKILEKLDHPNIIKFREVYLTKKPKLTLCIVMDFADGGDLQSRIKSQKGKIFNENQILDWFTQICLAIKHIHDRKILHRDIKSQNIFLTKNGLVKLGDFGIAKCLNTTMDKAKTIVGTPYYLSPEIVQNKPYSFKSDIWSLGILLYEMCALKMPFDASSLPMLSLKIIRGAYNPLPATLSKEIRNLVANMLAVDTNKRPTITEVLKQPIIRSRIKYFLSEMEYSKEFSHTILHNFNVFKNSNPEKDKVSQKISEANSLVTNASQGSITNEKKEKKEILKEKELNVITKEVGTPSQNQKPIIFDNKKENANVNLKNIMDINKIDVKLEKKNYHFDKKNSKNDSEEKKEKASGSSNLIQDRKRNITIGDNVETNRINPKDRKKENSRDPANANNNMINNNPNFEIKKPNVCSTNNLINANNDKKKLSGGHLNVNNIKEGSNEKKRSDSKSSQEDKNSQRKKDPSHLKDFLNNMRDKMKNSPYNKDSANIVQWGGREQDYNNNFSPNHNNVQPQQKKESNNNSKEKFSNLLNHNNKDNNIHTNEDNPADLKDYLATHKMLIELEKIECDDSVEHNEKDKIEINENALNESILREMGLINFKEGFNIEGEAREEFNIDEQINSKFDYEEMCENNIEKRNEKVELKHDIIGNNFVSNDNMYEVIKHELENELEKHNFDKLYRIVDENTKNNSVSFELDGLNRCIYEEFSGRYDNNRIENFISRVPEIFTIIVKDREYLVEIK